MLKKRIIPVILCDESIISEFLLEITKLILSIFNELATDCTFPDP
tara:strand:- start:1695 stop:1829 length:135 start_codon:yes stop_codon:yes gene_type:complete